MLYLQIHSYTVHGHYCKVKSIFVKTMDKSSNLGPVNGSPVTKDPELVVLCSMLDEAHTNAIKRLRRRVKIKHHFPER